MIAQMSMLDIEAAVLRNMADAIDAWEGSAFYRTIGMQWGRNIPTRRAGSGSDMSTRST